MANLQTIRLTRSPRALVFLHGFHGGVDDTWDRLPYILAADKSLDSWNILNFGYSSSLLPGTPGIWSADADLPKLALSFFTEINIAPLSHCTEVAVAAHSMGGLLVQRSLLDNPNLAAKVRHLFLFGTPSAGVHKANFMRHLLGGFAGEQVRNMACESQFITSLRADWERAFGEHPPFQFYAIAGEKDNFVPSESSLLPFPAQFRRVIAGDHLSMIKPRDAHADVVRLLVSALTDTTEPLEPASPLRLAAELGDADPAGMAVAQDVVSGKQPVTTEAEIVEAALALARIQERHAAILLLQRHQQLGTDVKGTLAGRIKRRWIQDGSEADAYWALGLYSSALQTTRVLPESRDTISQLFYHAINVAFLKLVAFDEVPEAREMASLALQYANRLSPPDDWSVATQAEAWLQLGDDLKAIAQYRRMIDLSPAKWKLTSTGQQALQIAAKLKKPFLLEQLRNIFDPPPVSSLAASSKS